MPDFCHVQIPVYKQGLLQTRQPQAISLGVADPCTQAMDTVPLGALRASWLPRGGQTQPAQRLHGHSLVMRSWLLGIDSEHSELV